MKKFNFFLQGLLMLLLNEVNAQTQFVHEWAFQSAINGANEQINDAVYDSLGNIYQTGIQNLTTGMVLVQKINASGVPQWTKNFTGNSGSYNLGTSITLDKNENVLICGSFQNTLGVIGGSILSSNGNDDVFLAKYNASGTHQWSFSIGGASLDQAFSITTDDNNDVYITGYFIGTVDFNPNGTTANLTSNGAEDIFLAKYDSNGNYLWAINVGSVNGSNIGYGVVSDSIGNVYVSGQFFGTADFNPSVTTNSLTSNGASDIFVAKYTTNGDYLFAFNIGSTNGDVAKNMAIDNDGFVYIAGDFNGTVDFNPNAGINQLVSTVTHGFLAKYDSLGNYDWAINIGDQSNNLSNIYGISNNISNEIVVSGSFINIIDVDPSGSFDTLVSNGSHDIFTAVYSSSGSLIKAVSFGSAGFDIGYATDISSTGKIFIGGAFQNTVDFDPSTSSVFNLNTSIGYDAFSAQYGAPPCNVPDLPVISVSNNPICFGDSVTLSVSSGNLNDADNWYWYSSSCGGTLIDTGASVVVSPSLTNDYFVRGEGNCVVAANCTSIMVNVNSLPNVNIDDFIPNTICLNSSAIALPTSTPSGGVYSGTGVSGNDFDPSISGVGTFHVLYTYSDTNSCVNTDSTDIIVNTCVGVESKTFEDEIVIAPNPFQHQIKLKGLSKEGSIIHVVDIQGRTLLEISSNDTDISISTENFNAGNYFVKIVSNTDIIIRKLIKQ